MRATATMACVLGAFSVTCGGSDAAPSTPTPTSTPDPAPPAGGEKQAANEDERGSIGVPLAAYTYCRKLGYTLDADGCRFPDGSHCEVLAFYDGQCGQAFTYCAQHGGTVTSETRDMGGWHAIVAVCTLDGKTCSEQDFLEKGTCGP